MSAEPAHRPALALSARVRDLAPVADPGDPGGGCPCTLLGAVYMETSRYDLGQLWYAKAVERGANEQDVDNDLHNIYKRANPDKKTALSAFLIRLDPQRYAWAGLSK